MLIKLNFANTYNNCHILVIECNQIILLLECEENIHIFMYVWMCICVCIKRSRRISYLANWIFDLKEDGRNANKRQQIVDFSMCCVQINLKGDKRKNKKAGRYLHIAASAWMKIDSNELWMQKRILCLCGIIISGIGEKKETPLLLRRKFRVLVLPIFSAQQLLRHTLLLLSFSSATTVVVYFCSAYR